MTKQEKAARKRVRKQEGLMSGDGECSSYAWGNYGEKREVEAERYRKQRAADRYLRALRQGIRAIR